MRFSGIIVAAGSGSRAGGDKQWRALGGKPVLRWSVEALLNAGADEVVIVVAPGENARAVDVLAGLSNWRSVTGGAARADSVRAGLAALTCPADPSSSASSTSDGPPARGCSADGRRERDPCQHVDDQHHRAASSGRSFR